MLDKCNALQNRFTIKKQLGQGSFSKFVRLSLGNIYSAYDYVRREVVALKVEKADKSKKILLFECQVLRSLQGKLRSVLTPVLGLQSVCQLYDFIESSQPNGLNFIVMQMLGTISPTIIVPS